MATEQCYNKGCGQKYDPLKNEGDSCKHHPGAPFFHDAYKGWSCCNKKCTDFTEFLNIKGCALGKHSNIKPPEPEKPAVQEIPDEVIPEVKPIVNVPHLERPSFDSPMTVMEPEIAPSLKTQIENVIQRKEKSITKYTNDIPIGTNCKNSGCSVSYEGPNSDDSLCLHHHGVPIFHEGLKYWSCCQKKTTDFNSFLNQEGCKEGKHIWKKEAENNTEIKCRWDYHQTGPYIVVSIYAKQYSTSESVIKLNPIRLYVNLIFPEANNGAFLLDTELEGVVDLEASKVTMYGSKVEIKLKKAEAGKWARLEGKNHKEPVNVKKEPVQENNLESKVEAVDLNDI